MEEAPENGKKSSHSAHANGMNEFVGLDNKRLLSFRVPQMSVPARLAAPQQELLHEVKRKF
jgi:hypothetical protein